MIGILIPPIPDLPTFGWGPMHLLLSHLMVHKEYVKHYRDRRYHSGTYLIMDNSAHENREGESGEILLENALQVLAQEVVCPDHLFDAEHTVALSTEALAYFVGPGRRSFAQLHPKVMLVPQGDCMQKWVWCLWELLRVYRRFQQRDPYLLHPTPVLGISKDFESWTGGLAPLIEREVRSLHILHGIEVHCLGWGRNLLHWAELAQKFPWIRSCDTAKPFVYAQNGISLELPLQGSAFLPQYPGRSPDYFTTGLTEEQVTLAVSNSKSFLQVVGDKSHYTRFYLPGVPVP